MINTFIQLWAMLLLYHGFAPFNKPYSQLKQWCGKEMETLGRMIVPVITATHLHTSVTQTIPFTDALFSVNNLLYFDFTALYRYRTEAIIE